MKLLKILSVIGILVSLFLVYTGYAVSELKASPVSINFTCACKVGPDAEVIPIVLYCVAAFFMLLSIVGLTRKPEK